MSLYEYRATLLSVVDGDTMHIAIDLGCDVTLNTTVRVLGINAPERSTAEGQAAKAWTIDWFAEHAATGPKALLVNTQKDKKGKYGRYLGKLTAPDGHVFNEDIVAAGHAVPYMI
jgi:micrococcal nuclease